MAAPETETKAPKVALKGNVILKGKLKCLTGLHIGGSKDKLEIGGVDSPVIRNPQDNMPYIPGSSLKGKLRSLLELHKGVLKNDTKLSDDPRIVRIFGIGANEKDGDLSVCGPTRLAVRDAYPDAWTKQMWKTLDSELLYTEYKGENGIDRLTSAANPRFVERVVAGSVFNIEMVFSVFVYGNESAEKTKDDIDNLILALKLLEHSYLGKSGTRGYGQVELKFYDKAFCLTEKDYIQNTENYKTSLVKVEGVSFDDEKLKHPSVLAENLKEESDRFFL